MQIHEPRSGRTLGSEPRASARGRSCRRRSALEREVRSGHVGGLLGSIEPTLVCAFVALLGCHTSAGGGTTPGTAAPQPAPGTPAPAALPSPAVAGPELPLPSPTNVPRPAAGLEVFAGPCTWRPLTDDPATDSSALWRLVPSTGPAPIERLTYGVAPPGFDATGAPAPLPDGCNCVVVEPCCDDVGEFEVRDGAATTPCASWGTAETPLPPGMWNAYEFTAAGGTESRWRISGRGHIAEFPFDWDALDEEPTSPPRARWTARLASGPLPEPLAFGWDPETTAAPEDHLPPERLMLEDATGRAIETYVRWLGWDRRGELGAVLLVPAEASPSVRLLMFDLIHGEGISGVLASSVGDVDGDGLADLALVLDPCLDECDETRGLWVEAFFTAADAGWSIVTLDGRSVIDAARERALRGLSPDDTDEHTGWSVVAAPGRIEVRLAGPGGGRAWTLRLANGRLEKTAADLPPGHAGSK